MKVVSSPRDPAPDRGSDEAKAAVAAEALTPAAGEDGRLAVGEAALAEVRRLLGAWLAHEPGARLGHDPEELHQLRVTARRLDATLGLAFAQTGFLYPFFGTLLGWIGVALAGSDTASNVLFGSLQRISSEHLGLNPVLMGAANSSGGVMGKMIDAQSIVVAATATNYHGQEGLILRYVFLHSIALASLDGILVMLQAYVWPFVAMVVH